MLQLNNIYNMDCIDGLNNIDDDSIYLIVTSPPYNIGLQYAVVFGMAKRVLSCIKG